VRDRSLTCSSRRQLPWCAGAVVLTALVLSFGPGAHYLTPTLLLERRSVLAGEPWRALTGHLIHGWPALALTDLVALAAAGAWLERRSRAELAVSLVAGALLASSAVLVLRPDLASYQGSSACATAVIAACVLRMLRADDRAARWTARIALVVLLSKLLGESFGWVATPALLGAPPGMESVPEAHAAGALGGLLAVSLTGPRTARCFVLYGKCTSSG